MVMVYRTAHDAPDMRAVTGRPDRMQYGMTSTRQVAFSNSAVSPRASLATQESVHSTLATPQPSGTSTGKSSLLNGQLKTKIKEESATPNDSNTAVKVESNEDSSGRTAAVAPVKLHKPDNVTVKEDD